MARSRTTKIDIQIGKNLKALRKRAGLSQTDMGSIIGVSFQQVQKYEKGVNRLPAALLYQFSHKLVVSYADFFEDIEPCQPLSRPYKDIQV